MSYGILFFNRHYVASGFWFAEEPSIYHKGAVPEAQNRLILLLRYAINDFGNRN